jgi:phthalate 4,5-cis-dihydrodiol dehydrogenase
MSERRLKVGIIGLGRAYSFMAPAFAADTRFEIVAGADPRPEARAQFARDRQARTYETIEGLVADAGVEIVYVASPHGLHCAHVTAAAAHGKHLLVEKPMALSLDECRAMIAAVDEAGVTMVIGHSHSFDAPVQRARALVAGGKYGRLRMLNAMNFTDFLYRPRRPEELDSAAGGGAVYNQAPHQVEMVRLLGGGLVKSVRAATGNWDPARPTEAAYSAFLTFEDGTFASLTYSGYAHFDSDEFCGFIAESGMAKDPSRYGAARSLLRRIATHEAEVELKGALNYGGSAYHGAPADGPRLHQHFGFLLATCEGADLRPLPQGVMIYGNEEAQLDALAAPARPRAEVMDELYAAVAEGVPPLHSGAWSLATMEVCLAILQSGAEQREIMLEHQVAVPREADIRRG